MGLLSRRHVTIIGAMWNQTCRPVLIARKCNLGKHEGRKEFLYFPDSLVALMGRDLLCKLRA
jgi:hypothetical protein